MEQIKSLTEKRLIIPATMNGETANFLIDTGATIGIISRDAKRRFKLEEGRRFPKPLVGAGGEFTAYFCKTPVMLKERMIAQFVMADITGVVDSIMRETGIKIHGIISLPQMKAIGMDIDANDNLIILE